MTGRHGVMVWRDTVRDHPRLSKSARLVGLVLSTYMNGDGQAFPSKATLAGGAGFASVRSVDAAVIELEAADLLRVRRTRGGSGRTNTYQATLPTPHPTAGFERANPAIHDKKPRNPRQKTPQPTAGESVLTRKKAASTTTAPLGSGSSSTCEACGVGGGRHLPDCPAVTGDE